MNKKPYEEPRMEDLDTAFLQTYEGASEGDETGDGGETPSQGDFE